VPHGAGRVDRAVTPIPRRSSGRTPASTAALTVGKIWLISASAHGTASAAPTPWTARETTSAHTVGASAAVSEAAVNSPTPSTNAKRRPKMSAQRPPKPHGGPDQPRLRGDSTVRPWGRPGGLSLVTCTTPEGSPDQDALDLLDVLRRGALTGDKAVARTYSLTRWRSQVWAGSSGTVVCRMALTVYRGVTRGGSVADRPRGSE
jgi:hypothetical protein